MKIYFENYKNICIKRKIKKIFLSALKESGVNYLGFSVTISFVDSDQIKDLNNEFRKIDKPTDVLSFPMLDIQKGKNFDIKNLSKEINPQDGLLNLGDIVICKKIAEEQAKTLGHSFKREICFLTLHGFLHLLGYDHNIEEEEIEMLRFGESILNKHKVIRV